MTSLQIANRKIKDLQTINSNLKSNFEIEREELNNKISLLEKKLNETEKRLMAVIDSQNKIIEKLSTELSIVKEENIKLKEENTKLKEENIKLKNIINKDCNNSGIPSSQSKKARTNNNLREKTDKKSGGQQGHKGSTITKADIKNILKANNVEHTVINHGNTNSEKYIVKYEVDVKTIVTVIEHRFFYEKGKKPILPKEFRVDVHYGSNLKTIVNSMSVQEVVSMERIEEFISILTNGLLKISQGSICNWLKECAKKLQPITKMIKIGIKKSGDIFLDLTETKVGKSKAYVRNFSTPKLTWYMSCKNKKKKYLEKSWIARGYTGLATHDHDTAMWSAMPFAKHVECNVHTRRYLKNITELSGHSWAKNMDTLLLEIKKQKSIAIENGLTCFSEDEIQAYIKRYRDTINLGYEQLEENTSKYIREKELQLLNRLKKYEKEHLMFMTNFKAQFDNNLSERDLRPIKTKKKVSGCHRNYKGLKYYCEIRSVISTCKKQGINYFEVLKKPTYAMNLINFT